jgi:hypothetical protein
MGYLKKKIKNLTHYFYRNRKHKPYPYEPLERMVEAFQQPGGDERVLYFGDSVVERVSREDVDTTPLGQAVADRLRPNHTTCVVSHTGYRPGIYLALSRVLASLPKKPWLVILPINVRCFSPQWDWNPRFELDREITAINRYPRDPQKKMIRLVPTDKMPVGFWKWQAFLRWQVRYPFSSSHRIKYFVNVIAKQPKDSSAADFRLRQIFIFHYLHPLEANHRQLKYLQTLLRFLCELGIPVLSYLTPINYQAGARYVGEDFKALVSENVGKVLQQMAGNSLTAVSDNVFKGPKLTVANWTFLLTENFFFHRNESTEHLNASGRNKLSDSIVRLVLNEKTTGIESAALE